MLASAPTKNVRCNSYRSGHFFINYQSIVQLFRIQPLQHGQHGGGLGAGGNGVHHQVVAALDGGCSGNLSLVLRHPGKGAAGQVKRLDRKSVV